MQNEPYSHNIPSVVQGSPFCDLNVIQIKDYKPLWQLTLPSPNAKTKKVPGFRTRDLLFDHKEERSFSFLIQNNGNSGMESTEEYILY